MILKESSIFTQQWKWELLRERKTAFAGVLWASPREEELAEPISHGEQEMGSVRGRGTF